MPAADDLVLAIDLGTSFTTAAVRRSDRAPEVMEIGGDRRMPGTVVMGTDGHLLVGRAAEDLADARPGDALRAPKRRLGDPAPVVLGGRTVPVVDLVAAVLRRVLDEAVVALGGPPSSVRLTHPAAWSPARLDGLVAAADAAGLPRPLLVPEPLAAAIEYGSEVPMDDGACVAVYDLGGGTFDAAVLRSNGGTLGAVGRPAGDSALGGELFDEVLLQHVGERLETDAWDHLCLSDELVWRRAAGSMRREVRRAKEALAESPEADLLLPLPDGLVHLRLTRTEVEAVVEPFVDRSVEVFVRCVERAGLTLAGLDAVYLVGGASRMPLVARRLIDALGTVPVRRRGDPKAVVALGAARAEPDAATLRSVGTASAVATARATVVSSTVVDPAAEPADATVADEAAEPARVGAGPARRSPRRALAVGAAAVVAVAGIALAVSRGGDGGSAASRATTTAAPVASTAAQVLDTAVLATTSTAPTTEAPTTTTEAPTTTTTEPLALDQAQLDAAVLTRDDVVAASGRNDWQQSSYASTPESYSFCGIDLPQPLRRSETQFAFGSGGSRRRLIVQAFTFATAAALEENDRAVARVVAECPQPSSDTGGVAHALSMGTLRTLSVPGADRAYGFDFVNTTSSARQAAYVSAASRGRVSVQVQFDSATGALDEAEIAAADALVTVMAARVVPPPS